MKNFGITCLFLGAFCLSCNNDPTQTKLQYMPDMADTPTVKAQEDYLDPPDHSVALNAIIYPEDPAVAEKEFKNPHPENPENLKLGLRMYNIYCKVCHGADGKGQGTLTDAYPKASVPDLTRDDLKQRAIGFYFHKITKGGPMMPGYGHATTPMERWQIAMYVKKELQK